MKIRSDVLIIGSGAGGLLTALYLAKRGKKVTVISKGYGATAMSSGCFDILGSVNGEIISSFREGFGALNNNHPYRVLSENNLTRLENYLSEATNLLPEIFSSFLAGSTDNNFLVITMFGTVKPTAFVQKSMIKAIISEGSKYLFIGFRGLYDYNPALQASMLKISLRLFKLTNVKVDYAIIKLDHKLPSIHFLENYVRDEKRRREFISKIREVLETKNCDIALIPALFNDIATINEIQNEVPLAEAPSPPPYRAGIRLNTLLHKLAEKYGVSIFYISDIKPEVSGNRIQGVKAKIKNKDLPFEANNYVLATGDLVGGGLRIHTTPDISRRIVIDSVFNVKLETLTMEEVFSNDIFSAEGQRATRLGFRINSSGQPVNDHGDPLYENLYAVGSVIGGYDYNVEKSGLGVVLVTSYKVAEEIIKNNG